jgi:predicted phosphohydrolase
LKGNHDYYWTGLSKMRRFLAEKGIGGVDFLHNASVTADGLSLCGTRGWCPEAAEEGTVYARELGRLRASLAAAEHPDRRVCFLHYPPVGRGFDCPEIRAILSEFGVRRCYYGHLHGPSLGGAFRGEADGVRYECISADGADFTPRLVRD